MKQPSCLDIHSFLKIYFITISRLKFAKFLEYLKNKAEAEISKRILRYNFVCYSICKYNAVL